MNYKKIKVLQVCAIDSTALFILKPLIDELMANNYDVELVCSPGDHINELIGMGYKVNQIKIDRKAFSISHFVALWKIYHLIKEKKFDIVHTHTPIASILGRVAAKIANTPLIIYTAHGFYFHERMKAYKRKMHILLEKIVGRFCTDLLFTQSKEDMMTAISDKIIDKDKVFWISNGVNIEKFDILKNNNLKLSLGFQENDKIIGFIGRLVKEKGIEELFAAFNDVVRVCQQARLLIIGAALKSDREKIDGLMMDVNNLSGKVFFLGLRQDIPELLSIMDVFTLPSHREGMPRSIIEAMAASKPVIATNIRGCREEVVDGVTGYIVPVGDSKSLARAMIKIIQDEKSARRMGEVGRKMAEENFNEINVLAKQIDIYNNFKPRNL